MNNENFFSSPLDETRLFYRECVPEGRPKAVIVFAHGMLEHSGRHVDWGEWFSNENGFAFIAADARGHGRSGGRRAWVRRFDDFTVDFAQLMQIAAERFPGVPIFAMGFSMGGAIATLTTLTKKERIPEPAGLILVAPAIRFRGRMFPTLHFAASLLDQLAPQIWVAKPNYSILSRSLEHIRDFKQDPLVHHGVLLLHFGTEILKAMKTIQNRAPQVRLPLLVLQGTSDWVVTPSGADDFVRDAGSEDKTLIMYDGLYHDLLHEPERNRVLDDIVSWISLHRAGDVGGTPP